MENLSSSCGSSDSEVEECDHTTEAEKNSSASTLTTVQDTPPLMEKDGPFTLFGNPITMENERMNVDDAGVSSVKARPFFFEPIKIDKEEENDTRLLFKNDSERKEIDFLGLWSSKERKEKNSMMETVQECPVDDETSIDLTLRLGPSVNKKRSWMSTSDDKKLCPSMNKKRKMVAGGPSSSKSVDLDFKIGLPVNAQENVSNVVPPNRRELVLFGQWIVVHDQDPWRVKKVLTKSDVDRSCRLLIGTDVVSKHILPHIQNNNPDFDETRGIEVVVWDVDTGSSHKLTLKRWKSNSFVFVGGWMSAFVKRRNLKENDEIGLKWDNANSRLEFSLLHRNH